MAKTSTGSREAGEESREAVQDREDGADKEDSRSLQEPPDPGIVTDQAPYYGSLGDFDFSALSDTWLPPLEEAGPSLPNIHAYASMPPLLEEAGPPLPDMHTYAPVPPSSYRSTSVGFGALLAQPTISDRSDAGGSHHRRLNLPITPSMSRSQSGPGSANASYGQNNTQQTNIDSIQDFDMKLSASGLNWRKFKIPGSNLEEELEADVRHVKRSRRAQASVISPTAETRQLEEHCEIRALCS